MRCLPVEVSPHNPVYQQSIHEAWKDFIDGGEIRGRVPDHILDGWLLSRAARIDPMRVPDVPVLERQHLDDLYDEFATLLTAASPVLEMLNSCIQGTGYMAILAAPSGHIIATVGDKDLLDMARTQYNMPGADRSINKVGASAIGMTLERCRPVQIFGYEHYNAGLHSWRCASAPILADASGVLAVLTISGNIASPDIQALAMVTTFANYIGMRVRQQNIEVTGQKLKALLRSAHDSLSYPLLVLDDNGGITHANRHASKLFTSRGLELSGRSATSLVSPSDVQRLQLALSGQRLGHDSLTFLTEHGPQRIACTFSPVELDEGNLVGMALSLNPDSSSAGGRVRNRDGTSSPSP
ncbi:PAS domain-containing protein [Desulfovibrio intestinalis]|uniref:Transcriptional regulator of acetoin/glycerol metabolism n=1 Tax=Desulfovibrio intestinalis TaxID=58621 RepID=A0A7W8C3E6_9BACT|nr:PAS domain-containing protein [Desulfovibrio intestinalis]MBB5142980.1 transcriptional regulator of acetoin/glycerol metabolism [Desulfovibrio intestinalis]